MYTNPAVLQKRGWNALHHSNGIVTVERRAHAKVYCKYKHNVGRVARATYANQGIPFYRLTPEKTTWKENYVDKWQLLFSLTNSPAFANSAVIKEKTLGTSRPLMPCENSVL